MVRTSFFLLFNCTEQYVVKNAFKIFFKSWQTKNGNYNHLVYAKKREKRNTRTNAVHNNIFTILNT